MLYLFDIDGTLVDTGGAGMAALNEATRAIFGSDGPLLDLAGSTDLGLIANIHAHFQIEPVPERIEAYFEVYLTRLDWNLAHGGFPGRVFEGVTELLAGLAARPDTTIGLLTGNISGGAAAKMRHFGLSEHFPFGAYGCDHADRNLLGPIALERARVHAGKEFSTADTWIIGDTPKDVACARALGARGRSARALWRWPPGSFPRPHSRNPGQTRWWIPSAKRWTCSSKHRPSMDFGGKRSASLPRIRVYLRLAFSQMENPPLFLPKLGFAPAVSLPILPRTSA